MPKPDVGKSQRNKRLAVAGVIFGMQQRAAAVGSRHAQLPLRRSGCWRPLD